MENSLDEEEFRKLFPNFDIFQFVTIKNKVYYSGDGLDLSLYSYIFWRARRKVVSLNLSEKGMEIWRQDKLNFLKNWRNFVESNGPEERKDYNLPWVYRFLYWYFKRAGVSREYADEFIKKNVDYKLINEVLKRFVIRLTILIVVATTIGYALYKTW